MVNIWRSFYAVAGKHECSASAEVWEATNLLRDYLERSRKQDLVGYVAGVPEIFERGVEDGCLHISLTFTEWNWFFNGECALDLGVQAIIESRQVLVTPMLNAGMMTLRVSPRSKPNLLQKMEDIDHPP